MINALPRVLLPFDVKERTATYTHPRGEAELSGNSTYSAGSVYSLGIPVLLAANTNFNAIKASVWCTNLNRDITLRIYVLSSLTTINLTTRAVLQKTIAASQMPHIQGIHTFNLEQEIQAPSGKYVVAVWSSSTPSEVTIARWLVQATNPARLGFYYSGSETSLLYADASGGTYCTASMQLLLDSPINTTEVAVYQHARGDSELAGTHSYNANNIKVLALYEQIQNNIEFDSFICQAFCTNIDRAVDVYIYVRANATVFNPSVETPAAVINYLAGQFPTSNFNFRHTHSRVSVTAGQYVWIVFSSPNAASNELNIRRFSVDDTNPSRHYYGYSQTGFNATLVLVGGSFYAATFKLLRKDRSKISLAKIGVGLDSKLLPFSPSGSITAKNIQDAIVQAASSAGAGGPAANVTYSNANSGLSAVDAQTAIDELTARNDHNVPRIVIPGTIHAVVGKTLQIFLRGMIESVAPYNELVEFNCAGGKLFPRFFEITPQTDGTSAVTVKTHNKQFRYINSYTANIIAKTAVGQPASPVNVMCFGDSLTSAGHWPTEFYRMLTQSGGTPAGLGYGNITFVGTTAMGSYPSQKYSGYPGMAITQFMKDTTWSPLYNSGNQTFTWDYFFSQNSISAVNIAYFLLGWNDILSVVQTLNSYSPSSYTAIITAYRAMIDQLLTESPSTKIRIIGPPLPSPFGGLGTNYGSTSYANLYNFIRATNGFRLAAESMVSMYYPSNGAYIDTAVQFDSEHGYPESSIAVNSRNAATEIRQTNGVHPATSGYYQIADAVLADFIHTYCSS